MSILPLPILYSLHFPQKMLLFPGKFMHRHFDSCTKDPPVFCKIFLQASERNRNTMKKFILYLLKPFSFLPAILVMYMIFSFSSQTGVDSGNLSHKISYGIVTAADRILDKNLSEADKEYYAGEIELPVRKLAHMTEYFILAICISFPLYVYGLRGFWLFIFAGLVCVAFACTDEFHQSFVAGRGPSKRDVAIDSLGALIGIVVVQIFCHGFTRPSR